MLLIDAIENLTSDSAVVPTNRCKLHCYAYAECLLKYGAKQQPATLPLLTNKKSHTPFRLAPKLLSSLNIPTDFKLIELVMGRSGVGVALSLL